MRRLSFTRRLPSVRLPLGRGFLTGAIKSPDDFRRHNPRFQGKNFQRNLDLVATVRAMAADKGVTAAQLALAWLLSHGEFSREFSRVFGANPSSYLPR